MKEYEIGEEFKHGNITLKCCKDKNCECCENCYFDILDLCCLDMICDECDRKDKTFVHFEEVK